MTGRNHYEVLGVARGASAQDIQRAYRTLALRYHPDVYAAPDAGRRFREVADAYAVLHDPAHRARYDATVRTSRPPSTHAPAWTATPRSRDFPRFVDEDRAVHFGIEDVIRALLRDRSPAQMRVTRRWPGGRPWTWEG